MKCKLNYTIIELYIKWSANNGHSPGPNYKKSMFRGVYPSHKPSEKQMNEVF